MEESEIWLEINEEETTPNRKQGWLEFVNNIEE